MADAENAKKEETKDKKGLNLKVFIIGIPLFVVQLVLVYFITANFLVKTSSNDLHASEKADSSAEKESVENETETPSTYLIYNLNDLIINPAGTNGQRLLLLSLGFGVADEENMNVLKENEIVIKDLILSSLSKKTLSQLSRVDIKDSLKIELAKGINSSLPKAKVKNIYFSKYVLN